MLALGNSKAFALSFLGNVYILIDVIVNVIIQLLTWCANDLHVWSIETAIPIYGGRNSAFEHSDLEDTMTTHETNLYLSHYDYIMIK